MILKSHPYRVEGELLFFLEEHFINSTFITNNKPQIFDFFHKNQKNNGFHLLKTFHYKNKLITYLDYLHIKHLEDVYGLKSRVSFKKHLGFMKPTPGGDIVVALFSHSPSTNFPGLGEVVNIRNDSNIFDFTNPAVLMHPFTAATYLEVINDLNYFPINITTRYSVNHMITDSLSAFRNTTRNSDRYLRLNPSTGHFS
jgi:hypothetical protein